MHGLGNERATPINGCSEPLAAFDLMEDQDSSEQLKAGGQKRTI